MPNPGLAIRGHGLPTGGFLGFGLAVQGAVIRRLGPLNAGCATVTIQFFCPGLLATFFLQRKRWCWPFPLTSFSFIHSHSLAVHSSSTHSFETNPDSTSLDLQQACHRDSITPCSKDSGSHQHNPSTMAMIKAFFAASVLASIVSAVPMPAPVDQHVNKRAAETHTITHTAWETIDVTTTVYVNDAEPTPVQAAAVVETTTTSVPVESPAPATYQQVDSVVPSPSVPSSPPVASPTSAAPVAGSNNVPRAGQCEGSGSGCSGDITYYNGAGGKLT